jgi:AAA+ ATPase superfamily predicted ATPase
MGNKKSQDPPSGDAEEFVNPFRPGAGHPPPHLAGRQDEFKDFRRLLRQDPILKNVILTGLRGVGKTVLLEALRPVAIKEQWGWVGTDLSESASMSEERMAIRILTDLSVFTSGLTVEAKTRRAAGFVYEPSNKRETLSHHVLLRLFSETPGLVSDKLKYVLEQVWVAMQSHDRRGIVFAYDEAQNLADHAEKEQLPLSLLLDVFQSAQRKGMRFLLVLTGLPTLFSKLVEARTYSERMFHVMTLSHLTKEASREAITVPIAKSNCPFSFTEESVETVIDITGGYPYFIQFVCKEVYDIWLQGEDRRVPIVEVLAKLDADFFSGRWANATDRQRDLLRVIAQLPNCDSGFTLQDTVAKSDALLEKSFKASHVNRMLCDLQDAGLVYKYRHGRYLFAVPLLGRFIKRQTESEQEILA